MKRYSRENMFEICKAYVQFHQNPVDYLFSDNLLFFMAGRFPEAKIEDCCSILEELRKMYSSL